MTATAESSCAIDEPIAPAPATVSVGERLRQARESRGLSTVELAEMLKLSARQVEALESSDWTKLPGHTFIRGFVRNYARAMQLDADSLLPDLEVPAQATPRLDLPQNATAIMPDAGRAKKRDYAAVLGGVVLVALAVVAYYVVPQDLWMSKEPPAEAAAKDAAAAPAPLFPPGTTPADAEARTDAAAGASSPANPPAVTAAASPEPAVPAAPAAVSDGKGLRFTFTQPSWVEVRDKSGQIVFSQLNAAGSQHEVTGVPPFALIVGNAAHVTVHYQGRVIDLQPRSKDDVARVTVE